MTKVKFVILIKISLFTDQWLLLTNNTAVDLSWRYKDLSTVQFDVTPSKKMGSSVLIVANIPWMTESSKITAPKVCFLKNKPDHS